MDTMKKLYLIILTVFLAVPAFAQKEVTAPSLYKTENGVFSVTTLSHVGWGYHFVESEDFEPKGSGEVFFNVLNFNIYPADVFGIELGLDCKWTYIGSRTSYFYLDSDHRVQALEFSKIMSVDEKKKTRSAVESFALSVPVVAKFNFGSFQIGGGAEANFNLTGDSFYRYGDKDMRMTIEENNVKLNTFSYNLVGFVGISNVHVFGKFYPKASRFLAEGSVPFKYWTLGVAVTL